MIKSIILAIVIGLSVNVSAETNKGRLEFSAKLTKMAQKGNVLIKFNVDPNDDTTLIINRKSTLKPKELKGDWTMYLFSIGTTKQQLIENGFNKVRIYTSQSKGINDYVLKIL